MDSTAQLKQLVSQDLINEIAAAAQKSPPFLNAFLANPKEAYREHFGKELLPGYDIVAERRDDGSHYLYLPQCKSGILLRSAAAKGEPSLSDDELELVIGGLAHGAQNAVNPMEPPSKPGPRIPALDGWP